MGEFFFKEPTRIGCVIYMFEFFSLPIYETGFNEMISILIKITLCVSLAIVLTATTSNIEIIYGLQKLKISPLLISILSFAISFS
mgnify:CR=1 FL=1